MPRFLKRIFPEHLFRREGAAGADVSGLQRSRRVLVRPSNPALYETAASNWRLGVFYEGEGDAAVNAEERRALRDAASEAESRCSGKQGVADEGTVQGRKAERVRRRLSKRHRMPG
ncbi:uncharacterized protein yc1106_06792 [Curvularia clavata]|uniref:Uncharacterized protein n=1 Tax=Curvularia clavata TaxID=95742 RepID=A0A9Q8ZG13_CURCL|nr:uncharacterized protein yc1106_06792 [Curvularia clavata]